MNKTININLAGMAFIIDENAYDNLQNYLEKLRHKFSNEAERNEIMNDIEARIAEMLSSKNTFGKQVISASDVEEVISVMGKPEDIAGEENTDSEPTTIVNSKNTKSSVYTKRRLFRDPDDKKVSGVISGLSHYFGIEDPVWLRLAAVGLCFLSFGTMIILYLILIIVIPEAETAAEKLQMKGEPVNISTIEKEIKDGAMKAGESIRDFASNNTFFEKVGHLILTIVVGLAKVIGGFLAFFGLLFLGVVVASLFGISIAGGGLLNQAPKVLLDSPQTITLFKLGLILFLGSIVSIAVYGVVRLIFGKRTQVRPLKWILLATWWAGIILMSIAGYKVGMSYKSSATQSKEIALMQPENNHLLVQLCDTLGNKYLVDEDKNDTHDNFNVSIFGFEVNGIDIEGLDKITIGEPSLQLIPSQNDSFYIYTYTTARGRNKQDADNNANYVLYSISQTDTVVNLPALLLLDGKGKWRAQNMKIRIAIPEGKKLSFADNIDNWAATVKGDGSYDDTYFNNTTWTTENGKVKCIKGENHFSWSDKDENEEDIVIEKKKHGKTETVDIHKGKVEVRKDGATVNLQVENDENAKVTVTTDASGKKEVKKIVIEKK